LLQLDLSALPGAPPPKKKLTAEELKARIAARRLERAEIEKTEDINREKVREAPSHHVTSRHALLSHSTGRRGLYVASSICSARIVNLPPD
jgi:hypothetical protein